MSWITCGALKGAGTVTPVAPGGWTFAAGAAAEGAGAAAGAACRVVAKKASAAILHGAIGGRSAFGIGESYRKWVN
jgi:hypothetical protein